MNDLELLIRFLTISAFIILHIYWRIKDKGFNNFLDFKHLKVDSLFKKSLFSYTQFFLILQLLGLSIFQVSFSNIYAQLIGLVLVFFGLSVCITARHALGKSWTNANKIEGKKLVTSGIYKKIRHPIYLGLNLMLTGGEIVVGSYLILVLPIIYLWSYKRSKKEEILLEKEFGKSFIEYKSKSYMFIPFIK